MMPVNIVLFMSRHLCARHRHERKLIVEQMLHFSRNAEMQKYQKVIFLLFVAIVLLFHDFICICVLMVPKTKLFTNVVPNYCGANVSLLNPVQRNVHKGMWDGLNCVTSSILNLHTKKRQIDYHTE